MTDAPRFEIERTPEGGAAVYIVEPVWAATFASEPEARAYVRWRESRQAEIDEDVIGDLQIANAEVLLGAARECGLKPTSISFGRDGTVGVTVAPQAEPTEVDNTAVALSTCLICGIDVAAPCTSTAMASAVSCAHYAEHGDLLGAPEPDADPEPDDLPEDDAAALAALAEREAPKPEPAPTVEITLIPDPADPTGGDPYHEAGEAFRRLKAGEQLGTVADELRLSMPRLRSAWARYQKAKRVADWQPGATVAKPAEAPLDDGWAHCARCRTKFNAARAQTDAKLPTRPTLCATCRSR